MIMDPVLLPVAEAPMKIQWIKDWTTNTISNEVHIADTITLQMKIFPSALKSSGNCLNSHKPEGSMYFKCFVLTSLKKIPGKLTQEKCKENDSAKQHCGIFSLRINYTKLTGKEKNSSVIAFAVNPAWAAVIRLIFCIYPIMGNNTKKGWTAVQFPWLFSTIISDL